MRYRRITAAKVLYFRWQIAIPIILLSFGVFLLVGCIYLPIPEHKVGPEKDFRNLLGAETSSQLIRNGAINRAGITRMLGAPKYVSRDGQAVGYEVDTETGLAIWPLCGIAADQNTSYIVRLIFDDHDVLSSWEVVHRGTPFGTFGLNNGSPPWGALSDLNEHGPELETPDVWQRRGELYGHPESTEQGVIRYKLEQLQDGRLQQNK